MMKFSVHRFSIISIGFVLMFAWFSETSIAQENIRGLESRLSASPNDQELLMELGRLYHDQAVEGDDDAVKNGFRCFDKLLELDSTDAVALVYRGSLWTIRARDAWWPPTKLNRLKQGTQEMDRAVEIAPDNMMVRLIRGIATLGLPSVFERTALALEDFIFLLRHPEFPNQKRELKATIFYYGGLAYERADEYDKARELFQMTVRILPGSDFAKRAQNELNAIGP